MNNGKVMFFMWYLMLFLDFRMLDDFGHEIEGTESKLDSTMKKIATAMHLSNGE